jgi:hypothetical protein
MKLVTVTHHIDRCNQRPTGGVTHFQSQLSALALAKGANNSDGETHQESYGRRIRHPWEHSDSQDSATRSRPLCASSTERRQHAGIETYFLIGKPPRLHRGAGSNQKRDDLVIAAVPGFGRMAPTVERPP